MKACPIKFNHPSEAQTLKNIGPKIVARLTDSLEKYCRANGLSMPALKRRRIDGTLLGRDYL